MQTGRKWEIVIGALFLIAMGTSIVGDGIISSNIDDPDYLVQLTERRDQVVTGALLWLIDGFAVVGIAVFLYPYLKKHHGPLALGYVGLRIAELAIIMVYLIISLMLITVSQDYIEAGRPVVSSHQTVGAVMMGLRYWSLQIIYIFNGVAGGLLCVLLYRSKIVPRFISVVGIIGYGVLLPGTALDLLGPLDLAHFPGLLLFVPGSVFEILLFPVWLFAKGLQSSAEADTSRG